MRSRRGINWNRGSRSSPDARTLQVVTGAGHLMRGYEPAAAADLMVEYLRRWAALPDVEHP